MKSLFELTAIIEAGTGLASLVLPSLVVRLLLGVSLSGPAPLAVARVGGTALLTLGVACWLARGDTQSRTARGLVSAMVIYNLGLALILGSAGFLSQTTGIALWPAVILHAVAAIYAL
jgi:hypothetical protein